MFTKGFMMTGIVAAMAMTPGAPVKADLKDGIVGGLVGGAVSGIIVNESAKARERKRYQTTTTTRRVYQAPANTVARQQVREEQTALNYFGFPAGTPDGVRGRNTRNATSQFQAHMGYPMTGYLADYERQFLISSYYRAQSGGMTTSQLVAQRGMGTRGLLHAYRDETLGVGPTMAVVPAPAPAQPAPSPVYTAVPEAAKATATTDLAGGADSRGSAGFAALPNLMGEGAGERSLASHCNQISLVTSSNGGFTTQASMTDPRFALNEQFCLARTYAIAAGESLAKSLQGMTAAQLEEQCRSFGPALRPHVAALSVKPQDEVMSDVRGFILDTGMSPAQMAGTARICLSVGYRTDNMDVALGSALVLTALGETVYAELMGHHLSEGFGTTRRPDLALSWYETGITALENGAEPVFAPGNGDRNDLIRKAAYGRTGGAPTDGGGAEAQQATALPVFSID